MFERKGVFPNLFISKAAQPQPPDQFKKRCTLQVDVVWCTSKPEFDNFAPESPRIQITNFRVNCQVTPV